MSKGNILAVVLLAAGGCSNDLVQTPGAGVPLHLCSVTSLPAAGPSDTETRWGATFYRLEDSKKYGVAAVRWITSRSDEGIATRGACLDITGVSADISFSAVIDTSILSHDTALLDLMVWLRGPHDPRLNPPQADIAWQLRWTGDQFRGERWGSGGGKFRPDWTGNTLGIITSTGE